MLAWDDDFDNLRTDYAGAERKLYTKILVHYMKHSLEFMGFHKYDL